MKGVLKKQKYVRDFSSRWRDQPTGTGPVRSKTWLPGPGGRAVFPGDRKEHRATRLRACSPHAQGLTRSPAASPAAHAPGSGLPTRGHPPHSTLLPAPSEPCATQTAHQFQGRAPNSSKWTPRLFVMPQRRPPSLSSHFCFAQARRLQCTTNTHTHTHTQTTSHNGEPFNTRVLSLYLLF